MARLKHKLSEPPPAARARRQGGHLPAAARHGDDADPAGRPHPVGGRGGGARQGVARHGLPLLPEPQRAGHRGRSTARSGRCAASPPTSPTAASACTSCSCRPSRASRSSSRSCAPRRSSRSSSGRSSAPACSRKSRTGAATACASSSTRIAPLAPTLPPAVRDRLHHALSVVYGIEPYMILKDIWGLPDREVERIALWMADALIDAALRDAAAAEAAPRGAAAERRARCRRGRARSERRMKARREPSPARCRDAARRPTGSTRSTTTAPASPSTRHPARLGRALAPRARQPRAARSTSPTAATPSERLDVFPPRAPGAPVLVYIHGGYWRALDKRDQSLRRAALRRRRRDGRAAELRALPGGHASSTSCCSSVQALAWVWRHAAEHGGDPSRIVVAGHSAGGHLAAMMLACDWRAVAPDLPRDLVQSGAADLRRLRARAAAPRALPRRRPEARRGVGAPPQPGR